MTDRPSAPATERNRDAILDVLAVEFAGRSSVLEIGSGTGQHAVFFAARLPDLTWQTSDRKQNHAGINAWIESAGVANVVAPLEIDVESTPPVDPIYDAIFSANTAHIMSMKAVECMFDLVGGLLPVDGNFCLYGPFNQNGEFTSESNRQFDASLRSQEGSMGIRDLEELEVLAEQAGMRRARLYAMPANNFIVIWRRLGI